MDSAGFKYKGGNVLVRMSSYCRVMQRCEVHRAKKGAFPDFQQYPGKRADERIGLQSNTCESKPASA